MRNIMHYSDFDPKPTPSIGGCLFNVIMLMLPFIGYFIFDFTGLMIGLIICNIGLFIFFFGRKLRGHRCVICGRSVINLGRGTPLANSMNIGTFFTVNGMRQGREGPGDECLKCGRVYCSNCAQYDMICSCGSKNFRTVRLQYK
jgi:hypothetical protein